MAFDSRDAFVTEFVPEEFAITFVDAKQAPLVGLFFLVGCAIAVNADFEVGLAVRFDSGSDIDAVLPDDWAGVAETKDGFLPANVFSGFAVPSSGSGLVREAGGVRAAELGPVRG